MASDWRQRQKEGLRKLLYETALELFQAHGYETTTVQQITDKVGVAKGTFFNHFPTKEHVVGEWYHGLTSHSLKAAQRRTTNSAEEAIVHLFADMARRATAAPELLLAKSRHSSNPLLEEAEEAQLEAINVYIRRQINDGQAQGELDASLDVEFFVDLLGVILTGSSRAWVRTHQRFDFPAVIDERIRFLFRAANKPQVHSS